MQINEFILQNDEKVNRAIHGVSTRAGVTKGGVGEEPKDEKDVPAWQKAVIAEYDRLGGLILKDNAKVKTGCFYDFEKKQPIDKPQIVVIYRVNDKDIEVKDGEPLPLAVRAAKQADEEAAEEVAGKKASKGKTAKKKSKAEDDEEVDA